MREHKTPASEWVGICQNTEEMEGKYKNGRCMISLWCLFSCVFPIHMLAASVMKHACVMCTGLYPPEIPELITAPKAFNFYIRLASRTLFDYKSLAVPRLDEVN